MPKPVSPPEGLWRTWKVVQKIRETDDVVTFVVERTDDRAVEPSLPGQYVSLKALMSDGVHQPRQCSLTRADDGRHRQFSVQAGTPRTNSGRGGFQPSACQRECGR